MPDEFGGIEIEERPGATDEFGGISLEEAVPAQTPEFPKLAEGATFAQAIRQPTPVGVLPPTSIVPAIKLIGGEIVPGQLGDTHPDIIRREGLEAEDIDKRLFQTPFGPLDRDQAAIATGLRTDFERGQLHSTDLKRELQVLPPEPQAPAFEAPLEITEKGPVYRSALEAQKYGGLAPSDLSAWQTFRRGETGRALFGPTLEELELGIVPEQQPGLIPLALSAPVPFIPGPETMAGKALLSGFIGQFAAQAPDAWRSFKSAVDRGDWKEAGKVAIETGFGAAFTALAGKGLHEQLRAEISRPTRPAVPPVIPPEAKPTVPAEPAPAPVPAPKPTPAAPAEGFVQVGGLTQPKIWNWLNKRYGIKQGGKVVMEDFGPGTENVPADTRYSTKLDAEGKPMVDEAGVPVPDKPTRIRINTRAAHTPKTLERYVAEEFGHWYDIENRARSEEIIEGLTPEESANFRATVTKRYEPGVRGFEMRAQGIELLARSWRDRPWFEKFVLEVKNFLSDKLGVRVTDKVMRARAEKVAVRAIMQAAERVRAATPTARPVAPVTKVPEPAAPAPASKEPWQMTAEEASRVTGLTWDKWIDEVRKAEKEGRLTEDSPVSKSADVTGYQDWRALKSKAQRSAAPAAVEATKATAEPTVPKPTEPAFVRWEVMQGPEGEWMVSNGLKSLRATGGEKQAKKTAAALNKNRTIVNPAGQMIEMGPEKAKPAEPPKPTEPTPVADVVMGIKRANLKPNTLYVGGNQWDLYRHAAAQYQIRHEGDPMEAWKAWKRANPQNAQFAPHVMFATDAKGRPWKVLTPGGDIYDFGTPEAEYAAGNLNAFRDEAVRQIQKAKEEGNIDVVNKLADDRIAEAKQFQSQVVSTEQKAQYDSEIQFWENLKVKRVTPKPTPPSEGSLEARMAREEKPPEGYVRLYRGTKAEGIESPWFTENPERARSFGQFISYVDVPREVAARYRGLIKTDYVLPDELIRQEKHISAPIPQRVWEVEGAFQGRIPEDVTPEVFGFARAMRRAENATTQQANALGLKVRSVADLNELLGAFRHMKGELSKGMKAGDFEEASKWSGIQFPREAIETAVNEGSNSEPNQIRFGHPLGERPLDWRTHPEIVVWLQQNAGELGIRLPADFPTPELEPAFQAKVTPGMGAAQAGEKPKASQIEQLTQALEGVRTSKAPIGQQVKQSFSIGDRFATSRDAVGRAVAGMKTAGDTLIGKWKGTENIDDMLRAKGELSKEIEARGWRLRQWERMAKKAIPNPKDQAAIAKWVDAGGDMAVLQEGLKNAPAQYKQAYADALNLSGDKLVAAQNVQNYFDARLQEAIDAGVLEQGVENYIHRMYESRPDLQKKALAYTQGGLLKTNPSMAKKRVFQFDWEAEKEGYRPVQSFIKRITAYEASLTKAIAAREFIKKTTEMKAKDGRPVVDIKGVGIPIEDPAGVYREATLITPKYSSAKSNEPTLPSGADNPNYRGDYVHRDYRALSRWKWVSSDADGKPIFVQGDVAIHPDYVGRIDALLQPSQVRFGKYGKILRPAMQVSSVAKQTMLDLSGFHQVQITVHGMEHKVMPWRIIREIDLSSPDVDGLLKGGLTLGGDYSGAYREGLVGSSLTRLIPGLGNLIESYHQWLFQDYIPRIKTTMALHALERNRSRFGGKMSDEAIFRKTANQANAAFGELNYTMLERSKTAQDVSRLILLAPDFLEARGRFAAQAFERGGRGVPLIGGNEQRMALLLGALTMYVTARIANKVIDGQYHEEPENLFNIVYNGHAYGLRTVQGDLLHLLNKPIQFWTSRLNPVYGRTLLEALTGRDYFGRKRSVAEQAWDAASTIVPISLRSSRERSLWESLLNGFGVTARRWSDVDDAFKLSAKWKEQHGIGERGEFIYDPNKDPLRPLKLALNHGDEAGAAKEIKALLDSQAYTIKRLDQYFKRYASMPFAGSKANDKKFIATLTDDQRKTVEAARQHKIALARLYRKSRGQYLAPAVSDTTATPATDEFGGIPLE